MELRPNHDTSTIDMFIPEDEALQLITGDGSLLIPLTPESAGSLYAALENAMLIMSKGPGAKAGRCVCGLCEDYIPGDPTIAAMGPADLLTLLAELVGPVDVSRETMPNVTDNPFFTHPGVNDPDTGKGNHD